MKVIVFTDPHIEEKNLPELEKIFNEILGLSKHSKTLICVGDYFDKKNPSATEIDFGTKWAIKFLKAFDKFEMVIGNHPEISDKMSSVTYLSHLGVKLHDYLVMDGTYYGHFMIKESLCGFNEKLSYNDLSGYKLSILGHQHSFQEIALDKHKVIHLGSVRYVDFGEVNDKHKYVCLVDEGEYKLIILNNTNRMSEVTSVAEVNKLPEDAKVRLVIKSFKDFILQSDLIEQLKNKYSNLKIKLDFTKNDTEGVMVENDNENIIGDWLKTIKDDEVRSIIEDFLGKANYVY